LLLQFILQKAIFLLFFRRSSMPGAVKELFLVSSVLNPFGNSDACSFFSFSPEITFYLILVLFTCNLRLKRPV